MGLADDFNAILGSQDSPEIARPNAEQETDEPPRRKRGRPKGSKNRASSEKASARIEIDSILVQNLVNLCFSSIVAFAGDRWAPLDYEKDTIATNLKIVLEKRLPEGTLENIPEYALALTVIFYVTRCLSSKNENQQRDNGSRPEGER